jgi:hypothetical protein
VFKITSSAIFNISIIYYSRNLAIETLLMKKGKTILLIILMLIVAVGVVGYIMWNKPNRSVGNEKGLVITAPQLVKEYQANEAEANKKYLDKAMQVTGAVTEVSTNQEGKPTIMLASDDAMTGVFCTLKGNAGNIAAGSSVTIKGFCSGMLSDVRLREAVIVK